MHAECLATFKVGSLVHGKGMETQQSTKKKKFKCFVSCGIRVSENVLADRDNLQANPTYMTFSTKQPLQPQKVECVENSILSC